MAVRAFVLDARRMIRTSLLAIGAMVLGCACAPPDTLAQMKDSGILVQVPVNPAVFSVPEEAVLAVALEYQGDVVQRSDCVTLADDVRAEAGRLPLSFDERGRWIEGGDDLFGCGPFSCGVCTPPSMRRLASDFDLESPQTVLLQDETRTISLEIEGLFAERTITRASPSTARVGSDVTLLYSRPTEALTSLLATFVGAGEGGACNASFGVGVPLQSDGTGEYRFALPAATPLSTPQCAGPWTGSLRVSFEPAFEVLVCEGVTRCTVVGNSTIDVELPLTVVP